MTNRVKFDPTKHPRGPVGRFIPSGGFQPAGRPASPRFRAAQEQIRDWRPGAEIDATPVQNAYRRGSLWEGTPISKLPPLHRSTAEKYQQASSLNDELRRGDHIGDTSKPGRPRMVENEAQVMGEVVEANHLKADTTVYRGVASADNGGPLGSVGPGDQIHDRGFSSTSLDFGIAADFGDDVLEIELPAGTAVAPMSKINSADYGNQVEMVVGRGAVFEVDSVEQTDRQGAFGSPTRIIRARLVGYVED